MLPWGCLAVREPAANQTQNERRFMLDTAQKRTGSVRWGIYHQEREFAREVGDPCLGVVAAQSKHEAEDEARRRGLSGPTGIWAHPLPGITNQRT